MKTYLPYSEQLKDKRWISLREELLKKYDYKCSICDSVNKKLVIHHIEYVKGRKAWEYNPKLLQVLCDECHYDIHKCSFCGEPFSKHNSEDCEKYYSEICTECGLSRLEHKYDGYQFCF